MWLSQDSSLSSMAHRPRASGSYACRCPPSPTHCCTLRLSQHRWVTHTFWRHHSSGSYWRDTRTRNIIKEFSNNDKAVTTEVQPHLTVSIKQLVIMIALTCSFPVLCQCFNGHHCLPCPLSHIPRGQGSGGFWSTAIFFPAAVTSCSTSCLFSMLLLLFSVLLQT